MITHEELKSLVIEWNLREGVIEKDYVIGWLLWGIGSEPDLHDKWIFKGGTCLKKCYIETYRFSEDLDFTVIDGGPLIESDVLPLLDNILSRVSAESGIDFSLMPPRIKRQRSDDYAEGRVYYRGPTGSRNPASIKLDLLATEKVVRPTVFRNIVHPYSDQLPEGAAVRCYSFEELFGEKIRALGERCRPRDLYDVINLYHRQDLRQHPEEIRKALEDKCAAKEIPVPNFESIKESPYSPELQSEWKNMLGHQLQVLPDL